MAVAALETNGDDDRRSVVRRQTCTRCQQTKAIQAFAPTGDVGEDLGLCRPCRGELKRAANRERVEQEHGETYTQIRQRALAALRASAETPAALPAAPAATPGPGAIHPASIYPILRHIFARLPQDQQWTTSEKDRWTAAWSAALDLEITTTDE